MRGLLGGWCLFLRRGFHLDEWSAARGVAAGAQRKCCSIRAAAQLATGIAFAADAWHPALARAPLVFPADGTNTQSLPTKDGQKWTAEEVAELTRLVEDPAYLKQRLGLDKVGARRVGGKGEEDEGRSCVARRWRGWARWCQQAVGKGAGDEDPGMG